MGGMSADQENAGTNDGSAPDVKQTLQAMRGGWDGWRAWTVEEQERIDLNECTDARCMNVEVNCGYQGLVEDSFLSQSAGVGTELRAAWKTKLDAEGKHSSGKSLRETIFGAADQPQ